MLSFYHKIIMMELDQDKSLEEKVVLVDKHDNEIGLSSKLEAHRDSLLHRAISVFIVNSKGEWLLHRRALHKYHSAGLWSNTCCSHPFPGESTEAAAIRRLREEMGMSTSLTPIFTFIYQADLENGFAEHELDHVFVGISDADPVINPNEVCEWKRIDFQTLKKDICTYPEKYSIWFKQVFEKVNMHVELVLS